MRGRYRVVSEIGAGVFGTGCLGEDESPSVGRREQPQTSSAPVTDPSPQPARSTETDNSGAVIDWLLNPSSQ
jgi:hypothetical protein